MPLRDTVSVGDRDWSFWNGGSQCSSLVCTTRRTVYCYYYTVAHQPAVWVAEADVKKLL